MTNAKKIVAGAALFALLAAGVLFGGTGPGRVAHADGCDNSPPPPGLDCPATPTPTPPPH